eukprot:58348_1
MKHSNPNRSRELCSEQIECPIRSCCNSHNHSTMVAIPPVTDGIVPNPILNPTTTESRTQQMNIAKMQSQLKVNTHAKIITTADTSNNSFLSTLSMENTVLLNIVAE